MDISSASMSSSLSSSGSSLSSSSSSSASASSSSSSSSSTSTALPGRRRSRSPYHSRSRSPRSPSSERDYNSRSPSRSRSRSSSYSRSPSPNNFHRRNHSTEVTPANAASSSGTPSGSGSTGERNTTPYRHSPFASSFVASHSSSAAWSAVASARPDFISSQSVFIHHLSPNVTENHVREIFTTYGVIEKLNLLRRSSSLSDQNNTSGNSASFGMCLLQYSEMSSVHLSTDDLDESQIDGFHVRVISMEKFDEYQKMMETKEMWRNISKQRRKRRGRRGGRRERIGNNRRRTDRDRGDRGDRGGGPRKRFRPDRERERERRR